MCGRFARGCFVRGRFVRGWPWGIVIPYQATSSGGRDRMQITVVGKSLSFPRMCACCAGPADSTQSLMAGQKIGNRRHMSTWKVPYCSACVAHVTYVSLRTYEYIFLLLSLGFYLITFFLIVRPLRVRSAKKHLLKPSCVGCDLPEYSYRVANDGTHTFDFKNPDFAKVFVSVNQAALRNPSPEVQKLLGS